MNNKQGLKKKGQQYTRKELIALGWTTELISEYLMSHRKQNGKIYFRAAEVASAVESFPELASLLQQNIEQRKTIKELQGISTETRRKMANEFSELIDRLFNETEMDPEVCSIAEIWHQLFIQALRKQPRSINYRIVPASQFSREIRQITHKKRGAAGVMASHWIELGKSAWAVLTQETAPEAASTSYIRALVFLSEREIREQLVSKGITEPVSNILALPSIQERYPCQCDLYECYTTFFVPESISKDLSKLIAVDPKDEYPAARQMARRFEIHVGGTNTGKTYESLQRLKKASSGVYLAPLRLLALEVQERLLEDGIVCSMLTGEEEDLRDGATHISSTVEKLNIYQHYEVAVIDECQMIGDSDRGFAWTRAILGVQAEEIHLCVAPEGLHILQRLLKDLGEPFTITEHKRKVPLRWESKPVTTKQAKKGDAFVAFSKKSVLQMAETLRHNGISASIIYGNLPYATRRQQMQMFLDGETTALVATDAIGMGLNLPIRRVIFTQDEKFDGKSRRPLNPSEIRQVAGRAGRFGIYDEGFVATGPDCRTDLEGRFNSTPHDVYEASLGFSDLVLKVDRPLIDVLKVWNQMPVKAPYRRMDISRRIFIINYIQGLLKLDFSKEDLLKSGSIPFDEKSPEVLSLFGVYCKAYAEGASALLRPDRIGNRLNGLEVYYKFLDLYYSFSQTFGLSWDRAWLSEEKELVAEEINYLLVHDLKQRGASCRQCGGPIPIESPYSICSKCYQKQRKARRSRKNQV